MEHVIETENNERIEAGILLRIGENAYCEAFEELLLKNCGVQCWRNPEFHFQDNGQLGVKFSIRCLQEENDDPRELSRDEIDLIKWQLIAIVARLKTQPQFNVTSINYYIGPSQKLN